MDTEDIAIETKKSEPQSQDKHQDKPKKKRSIKKPFFRRRWVQILGLLFIGLCLLILFGIPLGIKYYAVDWLKKNGADHAAIKEFGWNPFAGKVWLNGVDLSRDGKELMKQADLGVAVKLQDLLHKNITISSITYRGLFLEIEQRKDGGWEIATVSLPSGGNKGGDKKNPQHTSKNAKKSAEKISDAPVKATVAATNSEDSPAWAFLANDIRLEDCEVRLKSSFMDAVVKVDDAEINGFSTRSKSDGGTFSLHGSMNDAKIVVDLSTVAVSPDLHLAGIVKIDDFALNTLEKILHKALPYFDGIASINGKTDFTMGLTSKDVGLDVRYTGRIELNKGDIGSAAFRTGAKKLTYNGSAHYAMPKNRPMLVETDGVLQADGYNLQVPAAHLETSENLVKLSGKTTVTIGGGVVVNNDGELAIGAVDLTMPMLHTATEDFLWKGTVLYDLAKHNLVNTNGILKLTGISYGMDALGMAVDNRSFDWQGKILYQGKREGEGNVVQCDGIMALAPVAFEIGQAGKKTKVAAENLGYSGAFNFGQRSPENGDGSRIGFNGKLTNQALKLVLESAGIVMEQGDISLTSKSGMIFSDSLDIQSDSSLKTKDFSLFLKGDTPIVTVKSLDVNGFQGKGGGTNLAASNVHIEGVQTRIDGEMPLQINVPKIKVTKFSTPDLKEFQVKSLQLDRPQIYSPKSQSNMLTLGSLLVDSVEATTAGDANIGQLRLKSLRFLPPLKGETGRPVLSLWQLRGRGLDWSSAKEFSGKSVTFSSLTADIQRDKNGEMNITKRLDAMQKNPLPKMPPKKNKKIAKQAKKKKEKKKRKVAHKKGEPIDLPIGFSLGSVTFDGDNIIEFRDKTLKVPFASNFAIKKIRIGAINSQKHHSKTSVDIAGEFEKRAPLRIRGNLQPLLKNTGVDLNISLKNYPLNNISPYVVQAIGTELTNGQFIIKSKIGLHSNHLKMDNHVVLRKLATKPTSGKIAKELDNQLPIPLNAALSLIRDKNDNIDLDVPLEGELDDLHIGLSDIIVTALSKAVVPALSGYAIYALGPYGALAYAGMKLGEDMLKEGATPIIFMQGQTEIVEEHKAELAKVAQKMQKEHDDMQVCPLVASWEFMTTAQRDAVKGKTVPVPEQDRDRLDALGQTRAKNVQEYLMQNFGIAADRLLICTTEIKEEKKMIPLVVVQK